jgi:DNA repair exonuclease SbcCD ATPase subunit
VGRGTWIADGRDMKMNRIAVACTLGLAVVGLAGCASDPAKKANTAETELSSEQHRSAVEENDKHAEATSKHEEKNAEAAADKNLANSEAKKNVTDAKADLAQERRDFDTKTKERVGKIDARAKELKTKSAKLTGKKASDFKTRLATFNTQRGEVNGRVTSVTNSANDGWTPAKTDLEKKLDNCETTLDTMEKDL